MYGHFYVALKTNVAFLLFYRLSFEQESALRFIIFQGKPGLS